MLQRDIFCSLIIRVIAQPGYIRIGNGICSSPKNHRAQLLNDSLAKFQQEYSRAVKFLVLLLCEFSLCILSTVISMLSALFCFHATRVCLYSRQSCHKATVCLMGCQPLDCAAQSIDSLEQ